MIQVDKRVILVVATAFLVAAGVSPAVAGGASKPRYTGQCVIGADTTFDWQREKLVQVTVDWSAPSDSGVTLAPSVFPVVSATPPRGFFVTPTPSSGQINPLSATATFQHADGSTDQLTITCA
jgi:hypothetical protein